jgi:asparagine synthase (glutamine-hydrolysing)
VTGAVLRGIAAFSPYHRSLKLNRYAELLTEGEFIRFYQNMMLHASAADLKLMYPDYASPLIGLPAGGAQLNQMCEWDFKKYMVDDILVKVDRATMFHSIEGREPFLDHRLVEFAAQLPREFKIRNGQTKYLLKRLLGRYLPEHLFRLPKRGFGAPITEWTRDYYGNAFSDTVSESKSGLFDSSVVGSMVECFRRGESINYTLLWYLFSFETWYAKWMDDAQDCPTRVTLVSAFGGNHQG